MSDSNQQDDQEYSNQNDKPTPPVPPAESQRLAKHEKTVGTRTLEREHQGSCDCGGQIYYVERQTGRVVIDIWDFEAFDSDEYRLTAERNEIERYMECDQCGGRVYV